MSISIHLMLLFIDNGRSNENNKQTISIHLMLLFIDYEFPRMFNFTEISIHLMLLFIISSPSSSFTVCDFNTSHVTVYLPLGWRTGATLFISIHLMLLFIQHAVFQILIRIRISIHLMLLFIGQETAICIPGITDFNTSHVTVYHLYVLSLIFLTRFQYISCYCLSMQEGITGHDARGFQYISCYCLSEEQEKVEITYTIFQYISCYCLSTLRNLYPCIYHISIHLMLLFI